MLSPNNFRLAFFLYCLTSVEENVWKELGLNPGLLILQPLDHGSSGCDYLPLKLKTTASFFRHVPGLVASYRLYNSPSVGEFYTNLNSTNFIDSINATKVSGRRESHRIKAVDFNKNLFYAIIAVDKAGNAAAVSNVRGAFVPAPEVTSKAKNVDIAALRDADGIDVVVANPKKPDKIVVILAVGVLSFLFVCIVSVILIVVLSRRKKAGRDNLSSEENSIYGDNDDKIYGIQNFYEAKASIYDEQVHSPFVRRINY